MSDRPTPICDRNELDLNDCVATAWRGPTQVIVNKYVPAYMARRLERQRDAAVEALKASQRLIDEALPRFNWGASALDANAIQLLNEVPGQIHAVLREIEEGK